MSSIQSKALNLILKYLYIKKGFGKILDDKKSIKSSSSKPPKTLFSRLKIETKSFNNRNIFTLSPKHGISKKHILYLHGGGYVNSFNRLHWSFINTLIKTTGCTITAPDYPLAPEFTYKDSFEMVVPIYKEIVSKVGGNNVIIMGDSSGGGFALALAQKIKKENIETANQVVLLSPWLDITLTNPEIDKIASKDPILDIDGLVRVGKSYAGDTDPNHYLLSPINGSVEGIGKISVFIGTNDILEADTRKFKKLAEDKGVSINYFNYIDMMHDWMFFGLPESRKAIHQIINLVEQK